jgi:two-component system NtrC family sensor kinase
MNREARELSPRAPSAPTTRWRALHWILGSFWTLLVASSLTWNLETHRKNALHFAVSFGRIAFEKDILYRRWNAAVSPLYMRMGQDTPPNPHLDGVADRDIVTPSGLPLTLVNPAYMTRMVHELGETQSGVRSRLVSLRPLRPQNAPDPWESQALTRLEAGAEEVAELQSLAEGQPYMRLIRPLHTEQACLRCHGKDGYQLGDLRGGISIAVPLRLADEALKHDYWFIALWHLVLWLSGGVGFWVLGRRVVRHLRDRELAEARLQGEKQEQERLIERLGDTQAQLIQSEKMASIGQLAAGVAHEINNPVGYISSNLQSMKSYLSEMQRVIESYAEVENELPADSPALTRVRKLKQAVDFDYLREDAAALLDESMTGTSRVKQIIQDLKNFARADEEAWQVANIEELLDSTLNIVWNEVKYKAQVHKAYGGVAAVPCMPGKMSQVFMNLLVNAAQAVDKNGAIAIRTGLADGERIFVEIEDDGCGIPAADLPRLFEPFFTTKPQGKGTGLGLSISFGIVQSHNGDIEVRSEAGQGTCFRVTLPLQGGPVTVEPPGSSG